MQAIKEYFQSFVFMLQHNRVVQVVAWLCALPVIGTLGYMWIEGWSAFDGLFMTVITLSTIGYSETHPLSPAGRIFTMFLIVIGVGSFFYAFTLLVEVFFKSEILSSAFTERKIRAMENHFIVCGYGRMGRRIAKELLALRKPFVVVERDDNNIRQLREAGIPVLAGDAAVEETLLKAGILKASGLVTALDSDAANVFVVLTARVLNANLHIAARAEEASAETKLKRAGANAVLSPYEIGALRLTRLLLQNNVVDTFELVTNKIAVDVTIEEVEVTPNQWMCEKTLADLNIRKHFNAIVLAIKDTDGGIEFPPKPQTQLFPGMIIIVAALEEEIPKLRDYFNAPFKEETDNERR